MWILLSHYGNHHWRKKMTQNQDKIVQDLLEWADKKGNWNFVRDLKLYYALLKKMEADK